MTENSEMGSHHWVKDITENDTIGSHYLAKEKRLGKTRNGKPFMSLTLADKTGEVAAKVWEDAERLFSMFHQGDVIEVKGNAESFRGQVQITVSELTPLKGEMDLSVFLESAPGNTAQMMKTLVDILDPEV